MAGHFARSSRGFRPLGGANDRDHVHGYVGHDDGPHGDEHENDHDGVHANECVLVNEHAHVHANERAHVNDRVHANERVHVNEHDRADACGLHDDRDGAYEHGRHRSRLPR